MISETDIIYLAGFFDGEGTVAAHVNNRGSFHYGISIAQKHGAVLYWAQGLFGGSINAHQKQTTGIWNLSGKAAYSFLKQIYPYIKVKKLDIECMLDIWENRMDSQLHIRKEFVVERVDQMRNTRRAEQINYEEGYWQ